MADVTEGASANERLLAAARSDNEEMLLQVFDDGAGFDINHQDGQGNTARVISALHYAASRGSIDLLELILTHEDCDVDPINYTDKQTPLHLAVRLDDPEPRREVVGSLLDAGANMTIRDKYGSTALDYVRKTETAIIDLFRRAEVQAAIDAEDIADGDGEDDYEDDEGDD